MATNRRNHAIDENETYQLNMQLRNKAIVAGPNTNNVEATVEAPRRMVLGQLNKDFNANQKALKESLKAIKPKVDTHWKRSDAVVPKKATTTTNTAKVIVPPATTTVAEAVRKVNAKCATAATAVVPAAAIIPRPRIFQKLATTVAAKNVVKEHRLVPSSQAAVEMPEEPLSHTSRMLIDHVDDIDSLDNDNIFLLSEYVCDIYNYLQELEVRYPIREGFLAEHVEINARMRATLIEWINEVHFQFKLLPETYFMSVGLIDRYLQTAPQLSRKHLQLVGTAALFVASKYEELYPPLLEDFVYITDNTYSMRQLIEMEKQILKALNFELCPPVSILFLRRYSKAARSDPSTHLLAKYFIELATVDYTLSHHPTSMIAAASLYLALILFRNKTSVNEARFREYWTKDSSRTSSSSNSPSRAQLWTATLAHYSNYTEAELRPIVKKLAAFVLAAPRTKTCKSIYNKYSLPKFEKYALLPELSGDLLRTVAEF